MEAGSLLAEALERRIDEELENTLVIDVYELDLIDTSDSMEHLLRLAEVGVQINQFFQRHNNNNNYPWQTGGDGPVFGVHLTSSKKTDKTIPHLRAYCHYGVSVADEWYAIGLIQQVTLERSNLAVECWDMDDGQVLLIQAAYVLPSWVDDIGPDACRHRCWLRRGEIHLIGPDRDSASSQHALSVKDALLTLKSNSSLVTSLSNVNLAVNERIRNVTSGALFHKAALALPRAVAHLFQVRPDLISMACSSFADAALSNHQSDKKTEFVLPLEGFGEDWVWTTLSLGRTQYAMLRTIVSTPDWKGEDAIPERYQSIELGRLQRQCVLETTPHLRYGVQIGVRLVFGLNCLLSSRGDTKQHEASQLSAIEQRVLHYWLRIATQYRPGEENWLWEAWQAGPNSAKYSLENIMKCPVFDEEVRESVTALSHPGQSVAEQIRSELRKSTKTTKQFPIPTPDEVDSEAWMSMPSEQEMKSQYEPASKTFNKEIEVGNPLDEMLTGVKSFMNEKGEPEGVTNRESMEGSINVNPRVFMNLLHSVLRAESIDELRDTLDDTSIDKFFLKEDLDDGMEEDSVEEEPDHKMLEVMDAMDQALEASSKSFWRQSDVESEIRGHEALARDVHVLSNMLSSLEAGNGGSGPVSNMLTGMGVKVPKLTNREQAE